MVAGADECSLPGDVTNDGKVTVTDIQCVILESLSELIGEDSPGCAKCDTDLNCDDFTDVSDVSLAIKMAFGNPLSNVVDADQNNIPDACEICSAESLSDCNDYGSCLKYSTVATWNQNTNSCVLKTSCKKGLTKAGTYSCTGTSNYVYSSEEYFHNTCVSSKNSPYGSIICGEPVNVIPEAMFDINDWCQEDVGCCNPTEWADVCEDNNFNSVVG